MFMTVHAASGAVIGQSINNIYLAFILGFLSHFILDLVPHGDHNLIEGYYNKKKVMRMISLIVIDSIAMATFILLIFNKISFSNPVAVAAGIFGAILPDLLVGIAEMSNKYFSRFYDFHTKIHNKITRFDLNFLRGFILQALLLFVLIKLL